MKGWRKCLIAGLGAALVGFLGPIVWFAPRSSGYFYEGRCLCGHDIYCRIQGDGYFKFSPGHGVPEHRDFTLRVKGGEWEVLGLPHSDLYWSPLEGEDKVIGHLRISDGVLYQSWGNSTNWSRYPRVHNVWKIWAAKLLDRWHDPSKL